MVKEQLSSFKEKELIHNGESSRIYRLTDGRLLKVVNPIVFMTCQAMGISYESKVLNTAARSVKEIVSPLSAVYEGSLCSGFTMEEINGVDINHYDDDFTLEDRANLRHYADLYAKIEEIVMKANKVGIVMPDLCTCDNIMILPDGSLRFIDFDGMQFGSRDKSMALSTSLGNPMNYAGNRKYDYSFCSFNKELDKTSLAVLMFLLTFNVNLTKVGMIHPTLRVPIRLENVFDDLGIEDKEFLRKIAANISSDRKGYYLQDDLFRIAENYDMVAAELPFMPGQYIKRLIRK